MKIDSKDAVVTSNNVQPVRGADTAVYTKETRTDTNDVKIIDAKKGEIKLDTLSISSLSPLEKKELPIPDKVVIDAIEKANKAISGGNRRFEFSIHEKTKEIMVKVIDSDTNEVIREIPPEKTLDMVAKLWEMAGIIVDERR